MTNKDRIGPNLGLLERNDLGDVLDQRRQVLWGVLDKGRRFLAATEGLNAYQTVGFEPMEVFKLSGGESRSRPLVVEVGRVGGAGVRVRVWETDMDCGGQKISRPVSGNKFVELSRGSQGDLEVRDGCFVSVDGERVGVELEGRPKGASEVSREDVVLFEAAGKVLETQALVLGGQLDKINGDIAKIDGLRAVVDRAEDTKMKGAVVRAAKLAEARAEGKLNLGDMGRLVKDLLVLVEKRRGNQMKIVFEGLLVTFIVAVAGAAVGNMIGGTDVAIVGFMMGGAGGLYVSIVRPEDRENADENIFNIFDAKLERKLTK